METSGGNRLGNNRERQIGLRERGREGFWRGKEKNMENRKIEKSKKLKQIAIDAEIHKELKVQASKEKRSMKEYVESLLKEVLGI